MIVSVVLVLVAKFEERNKEGSGSFRTAAPVAKLFSQTLDEACLNVRNNNVSRERERENTIWFDFEDTREERKKVKCQEKKIISPEFSSFSFRFFYKIPNS